MLRVLLLSFLVGLTVSAQTGCYHAAAARHSSLPAMDHLGRGVRALQEGDASRARAELRLALEYDPTLPEAHNGLGLVALAGGNPAAAREHFEVAIRLNDDFVEAHANLGALEIRDGCATRAVPHLVSALGIDPGYLPARRNLAMAFEMLGRLAEARDQLLLITSLARDDATSWACLASVELAMGNRAAAARAAATALGLDPNERLARLVRANQLRNGGELMRALSEYDSLLANASDARAHGDRAVTLVLLGRFSEAVSAAEQAVFQDARLPAAHFALGVAAAAAGDHERAAHEHQQAMALATSAGRAYPEAVFLRAAALARAGHREEAIAAYDSFLTIAKGVDHADLVAEAKIQLVALRAAKTRVWHP
ncbi:MAG: tetratricopeptide repeat protein [Pseudomonadota bacterium]